MKKTTLLGIALIICALFSAKAQTDVTSLIVNPSFETGDLTGWTWTGATGYGWLGPNTDGDASKDGSYVGGIWNASIGDAECAQTINDLPNGFYKATALVTVSTGRLTNQRLFVSSSEITNSMLYGAASHAAYSVDNLAILAEYENYSFGGYAESSAENGPFRKLSVVSEVADGTITLGIRVSGTGSTMGYNFSHTTSGDAGFFKFDGFTLTEVSTVATLDNITLSTGSLDEAFSSGTTSYTASLPVGTTSVTPTAIVSVDGVVVTGTETVDVSGGTGSSTIVVTALDGTTTQTYSINYTVLSLPNDATLASLTCNEGALEPAFDPAITTYTVLVPVGTTSVTPTAIQNDENASLTGDGQVDLVHGKGSSVIVVTAQNGSTKTYTIHYDQAYITNPGFETGDFTAWTWIGNTGYTWTGVNTDGDATKTGSYVAGTWHASFGDVELSQTISGLENGMYVVTADLMGSNNATTSRLTTQRLFANEKCMLFGSESDYSIDNLDILGSTEEYSFGNYTETQSDSGPFKTLRVTVPVTDGTLTLGVRTNGKSSALGYTFPNLTEGDGHGWFKVDNFRMTYDSAIISGLSTTDDKAIYRVVDGKLIVEGADNYVVYNLHGQKMADVRENTSSTMISLPAGVYLVKTNNSTFKVLIY